MRGRRLADAIRLHPITGDSDSEWTVNSADPCAGPERVAAREARSRVGAVVRASPSRPERHVSERSNWLRAAVLGANDGILSTASLVLGVAASGASRAAIVTAGIAGLVAGAGSMAAGSTSPSVRSATPKRLTSKWSSVSRARTPRAS
jgi:VIT1/CCC1 family predicted Fe2+/Mn2+ transporter